MDVKHLSIGSGRLYQFTAIDEATRYRVLKIYDHNSIKSAIALFATDFTWHLHDLGIAHRRLPRGHPETNGKVERSHRTDEDEFYRRITSEPPNSWPTSCDSGSTSTTIAGFTLRSAARRLPSGSLNSGFLLPFMSNNPLDHHNDDLPIHDSAELPPIEIVRAG